MAKQVTNLSGIVFPALKAAKDYVSDVLDVYMRYCGATAYSAVAAVDVTTEWDNKPRPPGFPNKPPGGFAGGRIRLGTRFQLSVASA
jgi:hypothetical protein